MRIKKKVLISSVFIVTIFMVLIGILFQNKTQRLGKALIIQSASLACEHDIAQYDWEDTTDGRKGTCEVCGEVWWCTGENHLFDDWATQEEATCTEPGEKQRTCNICGYVETETIPAGHIMAEATCTEPRKCTRTGCNYIEGEALGHSWNSETGKCDECEQECEHEHWEEIETIQATCTGEGSVEEECTTCGMHKFTPISALGHSWNSETGKCDECEQECEHEHWEETETNQATCTEAGNIEEECSVCSMVRHTEIPALGHEFRKPEEGEEEDSHYCTRCGDRERHDYTEVVTQPTCTEAGYTTHTCTVCNYNYNDSETEPLGHNYTEVVTQPTCIEEGYTTHTCTACGDTYTDEEKPPLGHNYEAQTIAPTCTESGYTLHTCARCQENYKDNYKDPAGHSLITTITPPTCTEAGYTTYNCENCDFSYKSNYTAPAGHKYVSTITPPTCTEEGYTTYTCSVCNNHSYRTEYTKALGHTYQNGECVVCGIEAPAVEVASDEYGVLEAYITEIQPKTTVEILKLKLETNASSIVVYKENIDGTQTCLSNQELVVTGTKIKLSLNDKEIIYTLVVKGDVNGDGYADFKDMVEINKFRLRRTILENAYKLAGDVTEDEEIGFRDMVEINKYRLNRIVVL